MKRNEIFCSVCGRHLGAIDEGKDCDGVYIYCDSKKCDGKAQIPSLTTWKMSQRIVAFVRAFRSGMLRERRAFK